MATFVRDALEALSNVPGVDVDHDGTTPGDGVVTIRTAAGSDRYVVEEKRTVTTSSLPALLSHMQRLSTTRPGPRLLLTTYVPPTIATELERHAIAFADAAGNAHLAGPAAFVHIRGHRPAPTRVLKGLTATDLHLVFAILCRPRLLREPMRAIATTTGISLGKVSATFRALDALELVRTRGRHRTLLDPERLLQRWEIGYLETIRPRLDPSMWSLPSNTSLDEIVQRARSLPNALVGGEYAAAALTRYLKPGSLTLHLPTAVTKRAAVDLRLRPVHAGAPDVILVGRLLPGLDHVEAPEAASATEPIAHPILARAELLALGSDRLREVADRLRDDVILPELLHAV